MLKIGLTQRIDRIAGYDELREGVDIRWAKLLDSINMISVPLQSYTSNFSEWIKRCELDGIILTGGRDDTLESQRKKFEWQLLDFAKKVKMPVIGICHGMQQINEYCGGHNIKVTNHVKVNHQIHGDLAEELGINSVNSYHDYGITKDTLGKNLIVKAFATDQSIEAIAHVTLPWIGVMWHPERNKVLDKKDLDIIRRHLEN